MKGLIRLLGLGVAWMLGVDAAQACSCDQISPSEGFDRAQYVFTGKVVRAEHHTWLVAVDRVWKEKEKLAGTVRLMDVYAAIDCEFFFEFERSYLFFAILAKGGRDVFYHPQVCNWTTPLQSSRVVTKNGESLWIEDFIALEHGPGERPRDKQH
jgi:hypothetical protein